MKKISARCFCQILLAMAFFCIFSVPENLKANNFDEELLNTMQAQIRRLSQRLDSNPSVSQNDLKSMQDQLGKLEAELKHRLQDLQSNAKNAGEIEALKMALQREQKAAADLSNRLQQEKGKAVASEAVKEALEEYKKTIKELADAVNEMKTIKMTIEGGDMKKLADNSEVIAKAAQEQAQGTLTLASAGAKLLNRLGGIGEYIITPGGMATVSAAILAVFGGKTAIKQLKESLNYPTLIKAGGTNRPSYFKKAWESIAGRATEHEARELSEVVFPKELSARVRKMDQKIRRAVKAGDPIPNILLYGPPGTGKTMLANVLARQSDMYYAIIATPSFAKFKIKDAIRELEKIFEWAATSDKPISIFFDEADSIFVDKGLPQSTNLTRQLVNTFLNLVDKPSSKKIQFVFSTNHPEMLEDAILKRVGPNYVFRIDLPDAETIEKILELYMNKNIRKANIHIAPDVLKNRSAIAKEMEANKFAPRDIEEAVKEMRSETLYRKQNMLSYSIVREVLDTAIKQRPEMTAYLEDLKRKRLQKDIFSVGSMVNENVASPKT